MADSWRAGRVTRYGQSQRDNDRRLQSWHASSLEFGSPKMLYRWGPQLVESQSKAILLPVCRHPVTLKLPSRERAINQSEAMRVLRQFDRTRIGVRRRLLSPYWPTLSEWPTLQSQSAPTSADAPVLRGQSCRLFSNACRWGISPMADCSPKCDYLPILDHVPNVECGRLRTTLFKGWRY